MAIAKCTSYKSGTGSLWVFRHLFGVCILYPCIVCGRYYLRLNSLEVNLFVGAKLFYGKCGSVTKVAVDIKCLAYLYTINVLVGCIRKRSL